MSGHRLFQDDLASVSISRMRASGVVTSDTKSVEIVFGKGADSLRREALCSVIAVSVLSPKTVMCAAACPRLLRRGEKFSKINHLGARPADYQSEGHGGPSVFCRRKRF
jgi:hypothetical protein